MENEALIQHVTQAIAAVPYDYRIAIDGPTKYTAIAPGRDPVLFNDYDVASEYTVRLWNEGKARAAIEAIRKAGILAT